MKNTKETIKTTKNDFSYNKEKFFKLNYIIMIVVQTVFILVLAFGFLYPALNDSSSYSYKLSELEKTTYDYRVYYPSSSQITDMSNQSFIKNVFAYHSSNVLLENSSYEFETTAIYSSSIDTLNISSYNTNRLISGKYNLDSNGIYIDQIIAKELHVTVGDTVTMTIRSSEINFTVAAIFEDNTFYQSGSVFFELTTALETALDIDTVRYSGVLIEANNTLLCEEYLQDYIPLGSMMDRDMFSSNAEYDTYVANFLATDYSSEIYNKSSVLNNTKINFEYYQTDAKSKLLIGSIGVAVILLLLSFQVVWATNYSETYTTLTKTVIATEEFKKTFRSINIVGYLVGFALVLGLMIIKLLSVSTYNNFSILSVAVVFISLLLSFLILSVIEEVLITKINTKKY